MANTQSQQRLLEAILEKTNHVRGGITASDMDIVMSALDERELLISEYASGNFGAPTGVCLELAKQIAAANEENNRNMKTIMDKCNTGLTEARQKIQELKTGKKATTQYHGAITANQGAVFDYFR